MTQLLATLGHDLTGRSPVAVGKGIRGEKDKMPFMRTRVVGRFGNRAASFNAVTSVAALCRLTRCDVHSQFIGQGMTRGARSGLEASHWQAVSLPYDFAVVTVPSAGASTIQDSQTGLRVR